MTAVTLPPPRIANLDVTRGIAVMGILAMNIVAFAMPFGAYLNPLAYGELSQADFVSWLFSFIFIDGKMRGLFSFLFGASMLLVIERAETNGQSARSVHYRRMLWLLVFGLIHYYFIWYGDILTGYAIIGMIAWFFRRLSVRKLVIWGIALVIMQTLVFGGLAGGAAMLQQSATGPNPPAEAVRQWQDMERQFGVLSGAPLAEKLGLFQGAYAGIVEHRLIENGASPFKGLLMFGWETLAYMLFGMAALKSGFFSGAWSAGAYRKWVAVGFAIGIPAYAALAWIAFSDGFSIPVMFATVMAGTTPFRPLMVMAIAALIILLTRGGGAVVQRIAAAGRAAFTNYIGTSIILTSVFYGYGLGLYGQFGRAELWLFVLAMWALMLLWSKPWLDRFTYGPLEWLWRTLARWEIQPLRKPAAAAA